MHSGDSDVANEKMTFSLTFEKTLMQVKEAERGKANNSKKKIQQSEADAGECKVYGRMQILKCRSHALNLSKSKYFSQLEIKFYKL